LAHYPSCKQRNIKLPVSIQSLNARPVLDAEGIETGMFEVPAGGRRYRALQHLVKQKHLAKTAPVPCVVRGPSVDISAEEDSLPRTFTAHRSIPSTSSARFRHCARRANPRKRSPLPSSSV
jgi:hypothetical protein